MNEKLKREIQKRMFSKSKGCSCVNIKMGSYENQIQTVNPFTGRSISIDSCIYREIKWLWSCGVETRDSCCGHNKIPANVIVADHSRLSMIDLGYKEFSLNEKIATGCSLRNAIFYCRFLG